MLNNDLEQFYFSQSALSVFDKCTLKFRYRYLDGLFWPQDWGGNQKQQQIIEKGKTFHKMAYRYYDRGYISQGDFIDHQLKKWFNNLKEFRPYEKDKDFKPEYELRINKNQIKLLAKYDLLYTDKKNNQIIIYDWKTNQRKLMKNKLLNNYQTLVYLFVLYQAGKFYLPVDDLKISQIKIVYWNPRYPQKVVKIKYTNSMYKKAEEKITSLIKKIKDYDYQDFHKTSDRQLCQYCEYRPICYGKEASEIRVEEE